MTQVENQSRFFQHVFLDSTQRQRVHDFASSFTGFGKLSLGSCSWSSDFPERWRSRRLWARSLYTNQHAELVLSQYSHAHRSSTPAFSAVCTNQQQKPNLVRLESEKFIVDSNRVPTFNFTLCEWSAAYRRRCVPCDHSWRCLDVWFIGKLTSELVFVWKHGNLMVLQDLVQSYVFLKEKKFLNFIFFINDVGNSLATLPINL